VRNPAVETGKQSSRPRERQKEQLEKTGHDEILIYDTSSSIDITPIDITPIDITEALLQSVDE
jgi:hypothetical protein